VQVKELSGIIAVAAGCYHSLALKSDGTVWAWGKNYNGQLGTDNHNSTVPVQVKELSEYL
jgi:alpha-tubulin suppressor-like RCC1 family protein